LDQALLLPDSLQREAFMPGSPKWKNDENYGFGWRMSKEHPNAYFHFGWWKGYRSLIVRDVAHRRFLAILTNTTVQLPSDVIWDFVSDTTVMLPESTPWTGE
jgi:CubicO group peptidase (beta-lactamase class C family)